MNYKDFREYYALLNNKIIADSQNAVADIYTSAYLDIRQKVDALWAKVAESDNFYNEALRYNRYDATLKEIEEILKDRNGQALMETVRASREAVYSSYYYNQYANQWGVQYLVTILNKNAVNLTVYMSEKSWESFYGTSERNKIIAGKIIPQHGKTLKELYNNNANEAMKKIKDEITLGLIKGQGIKKTASKLRDTLNGSISSSERIVRTETHRNMLTGEYLSYDDAKVQLGDRIQRMIISVLDDRTRKQSLQVNQRVANEEGFLYPDGNRYPIPGNTGNPAWDINDREAVIDIIDDEPPEAMRGVNPVTGKTQVYSFDDYPKWLDQKGLKQTASGEIVKK
jgi:hypothetical protein